MPCRPLPAPAQVQTPPGHSLLPHTECEGLSSPALHPRAGNVCVLERGRAVPRRVCGVRAAHDADVPAVLRLLGRVSGLLTAVRQVQGLQNGVLASHCACCVWKSWCGYPTAPLLDATTKPGVHLRRQPGSGTAAQLPAPLFVTNKTMTPLPHPQVVVQRPVWPAPPRGH